MTRPRAEGYFHNIVVVDFEYEIDDGGLPNVLCMVAYVLDANLQHVEHHPALARRVRSNAAIRYRPRHACCRLFAWAEMTCFLQLGWRFPAHLFDQHTAYLASTNILLPYDPDETARSRASACRDACRAYGIEGWENIDKETSPRTSAKAAGASTASEAVFDYCEEDVRNSAELLRRQLRGYRSFARRVDPDHVMHWSNYAAKAVARIQARGMPIDMPLVESGAGEQGRRHRAP